jgi:hypothetical protein
MREFRVVIKEGLDTYIVDRDHASDYYDYYISREKRVRHFTKDPDKREKWYFIRTEPGMIHKDYDEIGELRAQSLIQNPIITIKKNGIGLVQVVGQEGYAERVIAYGKNGNLLFDEIQIEFEIDPEMYIPIIEQELHPEKIINKGLFDYVSDYL